jgi:hypothetical protein
MDYSSYKTFFFKVAPWGHLVYHLLTLSFNVALNLTKISRIRNTNCKGDYIDVTTAPAAAAAADQDAANEREDAKAAAEEEEEDRNPSPRLVNLNLLLRNYLANKRRQHEAATTTTEGAAAEPPPKSRILVFVQTRSSVAVLKSYLTRHYPDLKPNLAVGHGGQGGQSWGGGDSDYGQAAIIRDL